jgi:3-carboxy-cis,cis-muconate cycloisomerase
VSVTPFDSALFGPLLSDPEIAALLDDRAQIRAMLDFEAALAKAEARAGVIPQDAAAEIATAAAALEIDPKDLAEAA